MMTQLENNSVGTFWDHVSEFRVKIGYSFIAVVVGASIAHFYYKDILRFLLHPLVEKKLIFLSILDPITFILKIDFFAGLIIASPLISWSLFSFIRPAMTHVTWYKLGVLYVCSIALALTGLVYVYFVLLPLSLQFLIAINVPGIVNEITAQSYLNFVLVQSVIAALIFQIPLLIIAGVRMNFFKVETIATKRGYIYLIGTVVLALLTPTTDLLNFIIMLLPTIIIFEGSLMVGRLVAKKNSLL